LPRTVTQALLAGVAVVANDVDGTREVCMDGRSGLLVQPQDIAGLRRAILWMKRHPHERRAMAEAGREMCRARFAAHTMVEHLLLIYQACLRGERDFRHLAAPA
jgi:glycosyltransferase involved in cell wall biosynthesis